MLKKISILFFLIMNLTLHSAIGQSSSSLDKLDILSDKALEMTKLGRYADSETMLTEFSDLFLKVTVSESIFNMDELRIITVAHSEALGVIQDDAIPADQKVNSVTKFRLVIDAVKSTHQPLWTDMKSPIMETFGQTKQAVIKKDVNKLEEELSILLSQYDMIYPSLKVDLPVNKLQKLDARVHYIDEYRNDLITDPVAMTELNALQTDLSSIFDDMEESEADPSLWWVIISTGSIIIMTLSYVGWKKYKGGNEEIKTRKKLDE